MNVEKNFYFLFFQSIDSDARFDRLSKTYQVQSVQLNKKKETVKKVSSLYVILIEFYHI